jgi:hypothetical protein
MKKSELRNFGLVIASLMVIIFGLFLPLVFNHNNPFWPWIVASIMLLLAVFLPASIQPIYTIWMRIGNILGWINTRIILAIIFYTLFLLVSIILKLLGKDPMARKYLKDQTSYRVLCTPIKREQMENPY